MELSVSVIIADRPYRLKIEKSQEEMVRKAANMINETMKELSGTYHYKDRQDLLAMAALQFATSEMMSGIQIKPDHDALQSLVAMMEDMVQKVG